MKKTIFVFVFLILLAKSVNAAHMHKEKEYQKVWCNKYNGIMEFKNSDNTRIDCLTSDYAIEFDFAQKWAESVGQALYYGLLTNKKSGIVLITENAKKDAPYIKRAKILADKFNITLWVMSSSELQ